MLSAKLNHFPTLGDLNFHPEFNISLSYTIQKPRGESESSDVRGLERSFSLLYQLPSFLPHPPQLSYKFGNVVKVKNRK